MGFEFKKSKMTIPEILDGTDKTISANIDLLAKIYLEKTGRKVCRSCPSDIQYMILSLKNIYQMTQFKFKRHAAMYKNKKGDKTTISNATMTDEKAVEFLQTNPERIRLFSEFPSNWETLLFSDGEETEANKELRLAAEAEMKAVEKAAEEKAAEVNEEVEEVKEPSKDLETDAVKEATEAAEKAAEEAMTPKRNDLMKKSLKHLRSEYPNIKATSIKQFVDKVLA